MKCRKPAYALILLILVIFGITSVRAEHNITLSAMTDFVTVIECKQGQRVTGSFQVYCDGSLYPGDEQKYDDWMSEPIKFYIMNETEFSRFVEGDTFTPTLEIYAQTANWQFVVTSSGHWYIVYYNPSIYIVTVVGNVNYPGTQLRIFLTSIAIGGITFIILVIAYIKKGKGEP